MTNGFRGIHILESHPKEQLGEFFSECELMSIKIPESSYVSKETKAQIRQIPIDFIVSTDKNFGGYD
jgi:hypothetical protein